MAAKGVTLEGDLPLEVQAVHSGNGGVRGHRHGLDYFGGLRLG
jgi:hypothetical protein